MSGMRERVEQELLSWMRYEPEHRDEARFERLALALFRHQFTSCAPYRRYCEQRRRTPADVAHWTQIPAVPTAAFKELALRSFPTAATRHVFRTSGTTTQERGILELDTLELYEASLLPSFARGVLPDLAGRAPVRFVILAPPPEESPDSSLSHMFGVLLRTRGDVESGFFLRGGELDREGILQALARASQAPLPLALCGTAFSFVHLLDWMEKEGHRLELPPEARVMETGGFKGRSRSLERAELHGWIEERLGVPVQRIVNQYGMTELASQCYDTVLCRPGETRRKQAPPWMRVRVLDPTRGEELPEGEVGVIQVLDLANTGSVCAILTADLGVRVGDGFEVLGRAADAPPRGCSVAIDELLGG